MEMITVLFGRVCKIHDTSCSEGIYTIITLKTGGLCTNVDCGTIKKKKSNINV